MKYKVIAIEREYASGGTEIGNQLSKRLHIPCYGREILEMAAKRQNTTPEYVEHLEETATNSFLYSLVMMSNVISTKGETGLSHEECLNISESEIIKELALQEHCIIVGRGAAFALKERVDVLRVYIYANMEFRRNRAVNEYHILEKQVDSTIRQFDRRRSNFFIANTSQKWADKSGYHLMLDSSALGIDGCVEAITSLYQM